MSTLHPLRLHITSVTGDTITAVSPDGQTWNIPMEAIYGTPQIGQDLRLVGVVPGSEDAGQTAFAAGLLNELLTPAP